MEKQVEQLYKPIFLYIRKRVSNKLDAEDLTQEVFYRLSKSKNEDVKSIKNWVYTIARNSITDYYRGKKNVIEGVEKIEFQDKSTEENQDAISELSSCISSFVRKLPKEYRDIMQLSEIENIRQKEIAERLNMNYVTVRSKIQRGRLKLKNLISECCTIIQGGKGGIVDYKKNINCDNNC